MINPMVHHLEKTPLPTRLRDLLEHFLFEDLILAREMLKVDHGDVNMIIVIILRSKSGLSGSLRTWLDVA
jgi:hypothetical protein